MSFSVDKLRVAQQLDALGVHFIEGGCQGILNPGDIEFFRQIKTTCSECDRRRVRPDEEGQQNPVRKDKIFRRC